MVNKSKIERMYELIDILNKAGKAYYSSEKEIMSNFEYDALYDELVLLEKETKITASNSPTVNVGYVAVSDLPKVRHEAPMLSLDKTKDVSQLAAFAGEHKSLLSVKMDGLTVVLTYKNGELSSAVTRGNGEVGELITNNARVFKNLPLSIPFTDELVVRGEAVISYKDFEEINERIPLDSDKYKNPRNLCSGSVRQLNNEITASRNVNVFIFSLVSASGMDFNNSHEEEFLWLKEQGFRVVDYKVANAANMEEKVLEFSKEVTSYPFPSDGLVLMYDDIKYGESLGRTAKFPRNAMAFKWKDEIKETKLLEVEWSPSRTGLLNPVAIFEPVDLEGTEVQRASLHNVSYVEELMLGIGDTITVYKANMIIPQVAENKTKSNTLELPKVCPVCGEETKINEKEGTKTLVCTNEACMAKHLGGLTHFVTRDAFNIDGLSESTLEKMVSIGLIHELSDIFKLKDQKEKLLTIEGFGEKSYNNLIEAIDKSRDIELGNFLYSLGIANVGLVNARNIAKAMDYDIKKIYEANVDTLANIEGIGNVIATQMVNYFSSESNKRIVSNLLEVINIKAPQKLESNSFLEGKRFVITGSVNKFKNRAELKKFIEDGGGKVMSQVSSTTDYLINNDVTSNSSKNKEAKNLNIPIISEDEFLDKANV